jgi:hypothetical protein
MREKYLFIIFISHGSITVHGPSMTHFQVFLSGLPSTCAVILQLSHLLTTLDGLQWVLESETLTYDIKTRCAALTYLISHSRGQW